MFCTLEDAWGDNITKPNTIFNQSDKSDTFKNNEYSSINNNNISEHFTTNNNTNNNTNNVSNMYQQYMQLKELFENNNNNTPKTEVCIAVDNHIENCPYCKNKCFQQRNSFIIPEINLSNISNKIIANADIITILLFAVLIMLIFKLLTK